MGAFLMLIYWRRSRRGPEDLIADADVAPVPPTPPAPVSPTPPAPVSAPVAAASIVAAAGAAGGEELEPVDEDAPLKRSRKAPKPTAPVVAAAAAGSSKVFAKPPKSGVDRAKVGYRRVRISSEPDAVRSTELGRLDRGDEVEILDSHEGFLRVRTPDNVTGWILRHTILGT
jgi:hypothetical protein